MAAYDNETLTPTIVNTKERLICSNDEVPLGGVDAYHFIVLDAQTGLVHGQYCCPDCMVQAWLAHMVACGEGDMWRERLAGYIEGVETFGHGHRPRVTGSVPPLTAAVELVVRLFATFSSAHRRSLYPSDLLWGALVSLSSLYDKREGPP